MTLLQASFLSFQDIVQLSVRGVTLPLAQTRLAFPEQSCAFAKYQALC